MAKRTRRSRAQEQQARIAELEQQVARYRTFLQLASEGLPCRV
jgi:polyhydroxyalkanoate synthesis regulator phasin